MSLDLFSNQSGKPVGGHIMMEHCVVCKKTAEDSSVTVLHEVPETTVVHITCPHCKHSVLALVGPTQHGVGLIGVVTDLSSEDMERMRTRAPLTEDSVLSAVEVLRSHKQPFISLVKPN